MQLISVKRKLVGTAKLFTIFMFLFLVCGMECAILLMELLLQTLQCRRCVAVRRVRVIIVISIATVIIGAVSAMKMIQMLRRMMWHRIQVLAKAQLQSIG